MKFTKEEIEDMYNYIQYSDGKLLNELIPYTFEEWKEMVKTYDNLD